MAAEGLSYRGDEADFAGRTVSKEVFACGLAAFVGNLHERPAGVDSLVDFGSGDDEAASPMAVGIEGHEFDKTHDDACFAGVRGKGFDFVMVDAADQDSIHLGGGEA